ncbi:MAG TPA: LysE family translocator [Devosia sp.]|nr:LysE family translocator [Devosia sp.]
MNPDHGLLAWTILAIALVLSPGPDTMLVAGQAARRGFGAAMAASSGIMTGGLLYMLLCGFGFLAVLNLVPGLFLVVKVAGAIYLAWLGIQLLRGAVKPATTAEKPVTLGAPFRQGFWSTVLNPKVAIFFLAALPQFVGTGPEAPLYGAMLIAIVYGIGFVWCTVVALVAAHAGRKVGQSSAMRWFEGVLGAAFIGLAGRLALARNA